MLGRPEHQRDISYRGNLGGLRYLRNVCDAVGLLRGADDERGAQRDRCEQHASEHARLHDRLAFSNRLASPPASVWTSSA